MFSPALTVTPHIAAGTLRVLSTTGHARSALIPNYPTIAESGCPDIRRSAGLDYLHPPKRRTRLSQKLARTSGRCCRDRNPKNGWPMKAPSPSQTRPTSSLCLSTMMSLNDLILPA
jgi:hypothetical protein